MSNIAGTSYLEQDFETCIINYLCTHGGYTEGHSSTDYDKDKCLLPEKLISFIKKSQTKKLVSKTASEETAKEQLIKDFLKERNKIGTLSVLRKGFKSEEISFKSVYWKPENPTDDTTEFEANEYTAIRQLICNKAGETARPDIVLFVNGIPVVVMELKYRPAQTYLNAEDQYRERETDQLLFKFNKGLRNIRKDIVDSKYLLYFFRSFTFRNDLTKYSQGSNISNINQDLLSHIKIVIPALEKQKEIVEDLNRRCKAIDESIEKKQQIIEKLAEYKKSLIYECVTRKKEIENEKSK